MDTKQAQRSPQKDKQPDRQQQQQEQPRSPLRRWVNWILLAGLIIWNILLFWPQGQPSSTAIPYSNFLAQLQAGNIRQVSIQGADIKGAFVQPVPAALLAGTPTSATAGATTSPQGTPASTTETAAGVFANFQTIFPDTVGDPTLMPLLLSHNVV